MTSVSQATRPTGSSRSTASSTASEIWSAILSGWPSVTDSEVKKCLPVWSMESTPLKRLGSRGSRIGETSIKAPGRQRIPKKRNTLRPYARRSQALEPLDGGLGAARVLLEHEEPAGREDSRAPAELVGLRRDRVGRVREHEVEPLAPARRAPRGPPPPSVRRPRARPAPPMRSIERRSGAASVSTSTARARAAGYGLDADGAGAGIEVEHPGSRDALAEDVEERLPRARRTSGRAAAPASRRRPFHRPPSTRTAGPLIGEARAGRTGSGARRS